MPLNWTATREDVDRIGRIVRRAEAIAKSAGTPLDRVSLNMDLLACHANGCPLDLAGLEAADDPNLAHDVFGIHRHLDRETGALGGCFLPRYAARAEARQ